MDEESRELMKIAAEAALQPFTKVVGDLIGVAGGDRLAEIRESQRQRRAARNDKTIHLASKLLEDRGVDQGACCNDEAVVELLEAAQDEGREELRDIWAKLLAAMFDPTHTSAFRREFIAIAKQLEPCDAGVLPLLVDKSKYIGGRLAFIARRLDTAEDTVQNSFRNLIKLELIEYNTAIDDAILQGEEYPQPTALGRQFLACLR